MANNSHPNQRTWRIWDKDRLPAGTTKRPEYFLNKLNEIPAIQKRFQYYTCTYTYINEKLYPVFKKICVSFLL